jgi:chaperone modulatory protein CbpM
MIGFDELVRRFAELERGELVRWVENRWVLPEEASGETGERWVFHEVDVARVELILDIRREFAVDDEAMALVLGLLDQVYSLRRQMRRLCDALEQQPPEVRDAIRRALPRAGGEGR